MDQENSGLQELKLCDNCKKEVSAVNFLMHTVHCHRNIALCKICDEPFPKNEIDQHVTEAHSKIRCNRCGKEVEQQKAKAHEEFNCAKRLVKCGFCEMDIQFGDQTEHEDYCGSRTERCGVCGQYVMVKYLDIHNSSNHLFLSMEDLDKQPVKSSARELDSAFSSLKNFNNIRYDKEPVLPRVSVTSGKRTNDMPQINVNTQHEKQKEAIKPVLQDLYESSRQSEPSSNLSLEQLDRLLAMHMAEEEENFQPLYGHSDPEEHYQRAPLVPGSGNLFMPNSEDYDMLPILGEGRNSNHTGFRNTEGADIITSALDRSNPSEYHPVIRAPVSPEEGTSCLPCEFCNELFPADHLLDHQNYCQLTSVRSHSARQREGSNLDMPELNNSKNLVHREEIPPVFNNLIKTPVSEPPVASDLSTVMIPCEYCGAQFEADYIILHQSGCNGVLDESSIPQFETDKQSNTAPLKPKEELQTEQRNPLRHQPDPDMEYLDDLFLKEAIENSLKDKNYAELDEDSSERTQTSLIANLSLKSPKVRHVPIKVSSDYDVNNRNKIETAENNIREAKAHHANRTSPLVHRTGFDAPLDDRLSALYSNNLAMSRLQRVDPTGARPKSFVGRTSNELSSDAALESRPESRSYATREGLQNSGGGSGQGRALTPPRLTRHSLYDDKDVKRSNGTQQPSPKPVPPRRSRQQKSQY